MSVRAQLVPGSFFTREQWEQLAPLIDELLAAPGSVLLISVQVSPDTQNFPNVGFATFTKDERAALKRAVLAARRKRQASPKA